MVLTVASCAKRGLVPLAGALFLIAVLLHSQPSKTYSQYQTYSHVISDPVPATHDSGIDGDEDVGAWEAGVPPAPEAPAAPEPPVVLSDDREVEWELLRDKHSADRPHAVEYFGEMKQVHWVITVCERPQWSRLLVNTLLTAWASGFKPLTTTLVWCSKYEEPNVPPLLHNLRRSRGVKIMFLPDELPPKEVTHVQTFLTALRVPKYYNRTDVPLLITEGDVILAPNINERLSLAIDQAQSMAWDKPYLLNLFQPEEQLTEEQLIDKYLNFTTPRPVKQEVVHDPYAYTTKALLFSPQMAHYMARHFAQVVFGTWHVPGLQDLVLRNFLYARFNCSCHPTTDRQRPCVALRSKPPLAQPLGTVYSLYSISGKDKFSVSWSFPAKVAYPSLDLEGWW